MSINPEIAEISILDDDGKLESRTIYVVTAIDFPCLPQFR